MSSFDTIDFATLAAVTGGAGDAPTNTSTTKANGNVGVTYKGTQVGVQGGYESTTTKTNPAQCATDVRAAGGTPADVLSCYKLPSN